MSASQRVTRTRTKRAVRTANAGGKRTRKVRTVRRSKR